MNDSIWTRQRKLKQYEKEVLINLRCGKTSLDAELANDDWRAVAITANIILVDSIRMQEIERELEDVVELVEGYARIEARIEILEGKS